MRRIVILTLLCLLGLVGSAEADTIYVNTSTSEGVCSEISLTVPKKEG